MSEIVFMIHGMWGGPWCWTNYRGLLEQEGYRCMAPVLRFHDMDPHEQPDPLLGTTGLLDYADDLEREIRQLDEKPVLMGHSMGGLLAQILAGRGLAKALVLLAPAAPAGILALKPSVMKCFRSVLTTWGFWKKPMRLTFREAVYAMFHLLSPREQQEAYGKLVYESGQAACEIGFWFLDPKQAARVDETTVTCPVLVVGAAQDRITPAAVARRVAAKYKGATYKEFDNHAHWITAEPGWQDSCQHAISWMRSHAGSAPRNNLLD